MNKLIAMLAGSIMIATAACKKKDNFRFDDYDYTTVYFPYQYPVRTLVLGDYSIDNTNDNNLKFLISARVGGVYENKSEWSVDYKIDESLTLNLGTTLNDTLEILPSKYYTLSPKDRFMIPDKEFYGSVEVQLTDAFLDDSLAIKNHYVLPLRITGSSADSVLSGKPGVENPDSRIAGNWSLIPKDFTLFGIKYVNPYHGKYLHRGKSIIKDNLGTEIDRLVYRQKYIEQDEIWTVQTVNRNKVSVTGVLRATAGSPGNFKIDIAFDSKGDGVISQSPGSAFPVKGKANFVKEGDEWGNIKRNTVYLDYVVTQGTKTHNITDTIVFRDKDVKFEEFAPKILK